MSLYVGICVPALLRPTLNEVALKSGDWVRKRLRIETARVRGVPAIPRRSPRTPPPPGPHRFMHSVGKEDGEKGEHARRDLIVQLQFAPAAPNKRLERERGLNEMKPRERPSASPPNDGRVL